MKSSAFICHRLLLVAGWIFMHHHAVVAQDEDASEAGEPVSIERLVEQVRPSVVTVLQVGRNGEDHGIGSGFVIDESGLIATNLHVTGEGRRIRVRLADGSEPDVVAVHAWDRKLDLAIVRVDVGGLLPLQMAPLNSTKQGIETLALGNPEGLEFSVTRGVVSGLRNVNGIEMIQAAVPIERGNSGGPLIDRFGRVLGIVTLKSALTENLGFAVPVEHLAALLQKPNTVPMIYWQRMGRLNSRLWQVPEGEGGATWRQQAGTISVRGAGAGFGGRALCLSKIDTPELPYDVSVEVKLDDESGAGGIAFASDGADRHYGFYPTAGQLRLTRFDGPTVYSWSILEQASSEHFRAGDWNRLRVHVDAERIQCFLNGHLVIESEDRAWRRGRVGLCKFRETEPQYRRFQVGKDLGLGREVPAELAAALRDFVQGKSDVDSLLADLVQLNARSSVVTGAAKGLRQRADLLDAVADRLHQQRVSQEMLEVLSVEESDVNLLHAALLIAFLDDPKLIMADYIAELERMAVELEENLAVATTSSRGEELVLSERQKLELLGLYLFEQNGFHGSRSDYYNKSNSYLNKVLDDREGLPISLSVVYMELGRRVGLMIEGIPLPGRFVVRHRPGRAGALPQLVDVFEGGAFISEDEAADLVRTGTGIALAPDHLVPASKRDIIVRMLRNLIGVAIDQQDTEAALPHLDLLLAIAPEEPQERLSRAILLFQSGDPTRAKVDIEWLIDTKPPGMDIDRLLEWRASLEE